MRNALQCDTQCRIHGQGKAKAECNGRKIVRDVAELGPRGHVGPALMTTRELGSGTRKSQDERTRGRVGLGNDRAFRVGPRVLPRKQHRPTLTRRYKDKVPVGLSQTPQDLTTRKLTVEPELTSPVLADNRDQFRRALDCVDPTRRGASPTRRQETTSTCSCPGPQCRACSGSTRHLLRHPKRGGMHGEVAPRDSSILQRVSRLSQEKAPNT